MRKIASIITNYNQAYYVLPHIEMVKPYTDKILIIQGKKWENAPLEHSTSQPDDPSIFKKHFPDVEVIEDRTTKFCSDLYNQGMELLEDYDLVTRFDADFFLTNKDCERVFEFMRATDYDCYKLDFHTSSVNYYNDFYHGAKDQTETDPIAVDPKSKYGGFLDYNGRTYMINWEDFILHHLRQVKGNPITQEWLDGGLPYPFTVSAETIREQYTDNGKWYVLPQEIISLIKKWKNKIAES
jgi:hypothetical protein